MASTVRRAVSALLALLACLVLPLAIGATWLRVQVTDTDGYVATVGPLAQDDTVRAEVSSRLGDAVLRGLGTPPGATQAVRPAVARLTDAVVTSPQFAPAWREANRAAHTDLLRALEDGTVVGQDGRVSITFATLTATVWGRLADLGLVAPSSQPPVQASFAIADTADLDRARRAYDLVDRVGLGAPVAWGVLVALALLVSVRRIGTLALLGWGSALTSLALLGTLAVARSLVLDRAGTADADLVGAVWDVVVRDLRTATLVTIAVSLALAVVASLTGRLLRRRAR